MTEWHFFLTLFVIPFLWSGFVFSVRWVALRQPTIAARVSFIEPWVLLVMMVPVCVALITPFVPVQWEYLPVPAELLAPAPALVGAPITVPIEQSEPAPEHFLALWGELWGYGLTALIALLKNLLPVICIGYGFGLAATAWGIVRQSHMLAAIARSAEPADCLRASNLPLANLPITNLPIYVTPLKISPFVGPVFGLLRQRIVLPLWAIEKLSAQQLRMIIAHENKHIERGDPLWFWMLSILHCVFWFNPFVRNQINQCRQHAEFSCDQAAHQGLDSNIRFYASTLLKCAEICLPKHTSFAHSPAFFSNDKGALTMRIQTVLTSPGSKARSSRVPLVAMMMMGLLALPPVVLGQLSFVQPTAIAYEQMDTEPVPPKPAPSEPAPNEAVPPEEPAADALLPPEPVPPAPMPGEPAPLEPMPVEPVLVEPVPHEHGTLEPVPHEHDVTVEPAIKPKPSSSDDNADSQISFRVPLNGKVTSHYGMRRDPISGDRKFHRGTDIRGELGDIVVAPADSVVVSTETREGYGNLLTLDHGNGIRTRYGQLQAFLVEAGGRVKAGDPIAQVGSTGRSTGPHLHFEMWQNGRVTDPARFIDF